MENIWNCSYFQTTQKGWTNNLRPSKTSKKLHIKTIYVAEFKTCNKNFKQQKNEHIKHFVQVATNKSTKHSNNKYWLQL